MTPLDSLCTLPFHEAGDAARAAILRRLADTLLYAALAGEAEGARAELLRLDGPDGPLALACDSDERLAGFFGRPVDYAAMPGRVLARMLAEAGVALLVNPGAPSEMLIDAGTLGWLVAALADHPDAAEGGARLTPPDRAVAETLLPALGERLADMAGLARAAVLTGAQWSDGREGHLVLIEGAEPQIEPLIAKAIAELTAFLPPIPGGLDVSFAPLTPPEGAPRIVIEAPPAPPPKPKREKGPPILR